MIENKLKDKILIELIEVRTEGETLDYKRDFHFTNQKEKLELIKDLVSFANTKGGYIIYGVEDTNFSPEGLSYESDDINSIQINDYLKNYINVNINFITKEFKYDNKIFYVIYIERFNIDLNNGQLISFNKDGIYKIKMKNLKEKEYRVFRKYEIYGRVGDSCRPVNDDLFFLKWRENKNKVISNEDFSSKAPYLKFVERKELTDKFLKLFNQERIRIIQIKGLGGIGKTSFIWNFCEKITNNNIEIKDKLDYIFWITGKITQFMPSGEIVNIRDEELVYEDVLNEICNTIDIKNLNELELNEKEKIVKSVFENYSNLLVLDNMETITDVNVLEFIKNITIRTKVIITTRESLEGMVIPKIDVEGLNREEVKVYLNQQLVLFGVNESSIKEYLSYSDQIKVLTYGSPIIINMIAYQLGSGADINHLINGIKSDCDDEIDIYEQAMEFCFNETFMKLSILQKEILFILSIPQKTDKLLNLEDIFYVLSFKKISKNSIHNSLMDLTNLSFVIKEESNYFSPSLVKYFSSKKLSYEEEIDLDSIRQYYSNLNNKHAEWIDKLENYFEQAKAYTFDEKQAASTLKEIMNEYLLSSNYDDTTKKIDILIKQNPNFAYLYFRRALLEKEVSAEPHIVRKYFDFAVEKDPTNDHYWVEYAFYEEKKRKDLAKKYFEAAINLNITNVSAHHGLALTLTKIYNQKPEYISQSSKILYHFEQAYTTNTGRYYRNHNAINTHTHSFYLYNLGRYEEALDICEKGIEYDSQNQKLLSLKGTIMKKISPEYFGKNMVNKVKSGLFNGIDDDIAKRLLSIVKKG